MTGDILVFADADGSHDRRRARWSASSRQSGSRLRLLCSAAATTARHHPAVRALFGSQVITLTINYTLGVRLTDCQNGFRAIRRDVAAALDLCEDITTIEQEMIIKSVRSGYRMAEVATHEYVRANGESNFRVQDVWLRYLRSLVTYLFVWQPPQRTARTA